MPPDKAREMIHAYYASVSFVDAQIGKVLDELRRLELDRNTIVILWSDNGWQLGDHGRWSKPTNYETCARITLMISVPGMPENQQTDALVELIDIYPSLCELCRLTPPGYLEGTSFVPLLRSPDRPWKTAAFTCLIDYTTLSIRTERYRFIQRASGQNELYDCRNDPAEDHNLASDPASQTGAPGGAGGPSARGWRKAGSRRRRFRGVFGRRSWSAEHRQKFGTRTTTKSSTMRTLSGPSVFQGEHDASTQLSFWLTNVSPRTLRCRGGLRPRFHGGNSWPRGLPRWPRR